MINPSAISGGATVRHLDEYDAEAIRAKRDHIERDGVAALRRLYEVAQGDSGQCRYVARFLACCYNGPRFPFDFTQFRALDAALFQDCMAVLAMDSQARKEVHCYFENGGKKWEAMIRAWNLDAEQLENARERVRSANEQE